MIISQTQDHVFYTNSLQSKKYIINLHLYIFVLYEGTRKTLDL